MFPRGCGQRINKTFLKMTPVNLKRDWEIPKDQYRLRIYEETLRLKYESADIDS
jgi:hypothetical protein